MSLAKAADAKDKRFSKVLQPGIGIASLFSLSDCITALSRDHFLIVDPTGMYVEALNEVDAAHAEENDLGQIRVFFVSDIEQQFPHMLAPFKSLPWDSLQGTIIRAPFRKASLERSIVRDAFPINNARRLVTTMIQKARIAVLFAANLTDCVIQRRVHQEKL